MYWCGPQPLESRNWYVTVLSFFYKRPVFLTCPQLSGRDFLEDLAVDDELKASTLMAIENK